MTLNEIFTERTVILGGLGICCLIDTIIQFRGVARETKYLK